MSVDIDGIIAIIRTRPEDMESILFMALQRYPKEAVEIASRAIDAFPGHTARVAGVAARASPKNDGTLIEFVIRARPEHVNEITDGALKENPDMVIDTNVAAQSPSSTAPDRTAAELPPAPDRTFVEPPLVEPGLKQTFIEQPIYNPPPAQRPAAQQPAQRQVVRGAPPVQPPPPPAAAPQQQYQPAPSAPEPAGRSWLTYAGIGALVVMALVCGIGLTVVAGYELGFLNLSQPTATTNPVSALDQTLTEISSEVTLTSPAFDPTAVPATQEAPDDGVEPTTAPDPTDDPAEFFPTETPAPSDVPPTATASVATFTLSQGAFCRTGPSGIYNTVLAVDGGTTLPIKGKGISPVDNASIWWQVEVGSATCFISSVLGTTNGNLDTVPPVAAPPTPTPTNTPTPTLTPTPTAIP